MLLDLFRQRRSIRKFTGEAIEADKLEVLKEAALRPPSSMGHNPWEFVFVTDGQIIGQAVQGQPHGSSFLADARLGIVVCADPEKSAVWIEDASIATILFSWRPNRWGWETAGFRSEKGCMMIPNRQRPTSRNF